MYKKTVIDVPDKKIWIWPRIYSVECWAKTRTNRASTWLDPWAPSDCRAPICLFWLLIRSTETRSDSWVLIWLSWALIWTSLLPTWIHWIRIWRTLALAPIRAWICLTFDFIYLSLDLTVLSLNITEMNVGQEFIYCMANPFMIYPKPYNALLVFLNF